MKNHYLDSNKPFVQVKNAEVTMDTCLQIAARIWCDREFSHVVMDPEACLEIAKILKKVSAS